MRASAELAPATATLDADIYLAWEDQPDDPDAMAAELHEVLTAQPLPGQVRRVTPPWPGAAAR